MTQILLIEASPLAEASASRRVAAELVARLERRHPGARVRRRDLAREPPPFVDAAFAAAIRSPPPASGAETREALGSSALDCSALDCSEVLIAELEAADILVLGTPMHNYTVPAVLKAWIDQVVRAHRTFRGTPEGKLGLLRDRPAYIVTASGGTILDQAARQPDFLTPYLRAILATIGIRDTRFLHLDALRLGDAAFARERAKARAWMEAEEGLKPLGQAALTGE